MGEKLVKLNYNSDYIITYLGNKRKLIDFIKGVTKDIILKDQELSSKKYSEISFMDIFAGSGVVSRMAKTMGLNTYSNDLEKYSYAINRAAVLVNKSSADQLFTPLCEYFFKKYNWNESKKQPAYISFIEFLNSLTSPINNKFIYFSKHYAPKNTNNPDFNSERLFYTRENALKLDAILEVVHDGFMVNHVLAKDTILLSVFYHMLWNINTSGTMKGFHNGWGGKGGDALARIMAPIEIKPFPFIDGVGGCVYNNDATSIFQDLNLDTFDIVYADPPYNQHQYSANYHLLNSFYLMDNYNPGQVVKGSRAGIRTDHTRSVYSKRKEARAEFEKFSKNLKTKYLIVSYNNEGIIKISDMLDILSDNYNNSVTVEQKNHEKFKGGKATQSSNKVVEYLIVVKYGTKQSVTDFNNEKDKVISHKTSLSITDKYYDPAVFLSALPGSVLDIKPNGFNIVIPSNRTQSIIILDKNFRVTANNSTVDLATIDGVSKTELAGIYLKYDLYQSAIKSLRFLKIAKYADKLRDMSNEINKAIQSSSLGVSAKGDLTSLLHKYIMQITKHSADEYLNRG